MALELPTDRGLVLRAMASCRPSKWKPMWVVVSERFSMGCTYSRELCKAHGYNPDARKPSEMKEQT